MGLDPGTATTGYGVVQSEGYKLKCLAYGCVLTPKELDVHHRLKMVHEQVSSLIETYKPDALALEQLFFNKNVTTAIAVGQSRGVMLLAAADHGLEFSEYAPTTVKLTVAGYGKADKHQVQAMIRSILSLAEAPRPDDAADALALAVCHHNSAGFQRRVKAAELARNAGIGAGSGGGAVRDRGAGGAQGS